MIARSTRAERPAAAAEPPVIVTDRLDIRPITPGDLDAIVALHADSRVVGQLIDGVPDDAMKALMFLRWNAPLRDDGIGTFAVRRRGDCRMIGLFSLTPFRGDDRLLELGGKMLPDAWRGGLAVEAGAAMVDHAFGPLGRDRLVSAFHRLHRSVPIALARLGFTDAGIEPVFGQEARVMRLDRDAWIALGRAPQPVRAAIASLSDYRRAHGVGA